MIMTSKELASEVNTMVSALHIPYKLVPLGNNFPEVLVIDLFGVIVVGIDPMDYSQILNKIVSSYPNYRLTFITTTDDLIIKKDEMLWDLMRSGYMHYIRVKFPNQFKNLILNTSLGRKIIKERLTIWNGHPKYSYLITENKEALNQSASYVTAIDPSFFDFMPEPLEV